MTELWKEEMRNIDIHVEQNDIDTAKKGVCPITKSLERMGYTALVMYGRIRINDGETTMVYWVPSFVDDRMKMWDSDGFMEPFEFTAVKY